MFSRYSQYTPSIMTGLFTLSFFMYIISFTYITKGNFSLFSVLFWILFSASYILLLIKKKHKISSVFLQLFFLAFILFSLVNIIYISVFQSFVPLSFHWLTESNISPFFFLDYIHQIPIYIYTLTLFSITTSIATEISFYKKHSTRPYFLGKTIHPTSHVSIKMATIFFLLFQITTIGITSHITHNPKDTWWNTLRFSADIGLVGHMYHDVYKKAYTQITQPKVVHAQQTTTSTEKIKKGDKYTPWKTYIQTALRKLSPEKKSSITPLPSLTADTPPHIIVYQLETVPSWVYELEENPMPFLEQLTKDNYHVDHFIPNSCSTINAEFSSLCSQFSIEGKIVSDTSSNENFYCLPHILKDTYGYKTSYHHTGKPTFYNRDVLGNKWGLDTLFFPPYFFRRDSDGVVLRDLVEQLKQSPDPMFSYVIGYSSHGPHNDHFLHYLHDDYAPHLPYYTANIPDEFLENYDLSEEETRKYLWFLSYVDDKIKELFEKLEQEQLLENTMVIIYGDHKYYTFGDDLNRKTHGRYNEVPFVMHTPNGASATLANYASNLDIAPTLLHMLEGGNYTPYKSFLGTSLFDPNHPNNTLQKCKGQIDYVDEHIVLQGNSETNMYHPLDTKNLTDADIETYKENISNIVDITDTYLHTNQMIKE